MTLHRRNGGRGSFTFEVPGGQQIVVGDVVAQMGMSGSGAIEIESDGPLLASSRTYNESADGTLGLFLDGVSTHGMADSGDRVWLAQLRQDSEFRTNIGFANSGNVAANVRICLYGASGDELACTRRELNPERWLQLPEPFLRLAGRDDIVGGYATVEVQSGHGVIAYASVIDNTTNDGTAISMKR
jgi:hypothetical protein